MITTTLILAAALLGSTGPMPVGRHATTSPTKSCVAPQRTGTFRVVTKSANGAVGAPAILMLENIDGCLEATYVTDESSPVLIDDLDLRGDSLEGSMRTSSGAAKVTLDFEGSHVAGSIVRGRQKWLVEGRKTS
ncbi:MAG TPA: hypothetical protein VHB25_21485 [Gemmatimonadaceae bacterium]|nr:hypothetical protein [Gemmatimonadaceae bacterium]